MKCVQLHKIIYFQPNSTVGDYFESASTGKVLCQLLSKTPFS